MQNDFKFTIPGKLIGLNEYTKTNRGNKYAANSLKKDTEEYIMNFIPQGSVETPCELIIYWYEPNYRRDIDNIGFAKKFILDALVKKGTIENDSMRFIKGFTEFFDVDKSNPRIEVAIKTIENEVNR